MLRHVSLSPSLSTPPPPPPSPPPPRICLPSSAVCPQLTRGSCSQCRRPLLHEAQAVPHRRRRPVRWGLHLLQALRFVR
jgi:hypothetical protein